MYGDRGPVILYPTLEWRVGGREDRKETRETHDTGIVKIEGLDIGSVISIWGREKKEGKGKWLDVGRRYSATVVLWGGTSRIPGECGLGPVTFCELWRCVCLTLQEWTSRGFRVTSAE